MGMLPWLDQPVMLHSSRDPGECTMTPEQCAYKTRYWVFWYEADRRYGLPTVAFFVVAIILFTIGYWISAYTPQRFKQTARWSRMIAFFRLLSYKSWRILGWNTQSVGAMTLGPQPYYWPNTKEISYGNSPPIATRTGFLALAPMPFLFLLGAKANPITALTGISSEKLNIWHNWVAWAINRYYEFFKATHYLAALVFIIFFFFHCDFRMSSWDYFIATAALYTACWLYSQGKTYFQHGFRHRARLLRETDDTLRISIDTNMVWRPGQHIFLRFLVGGVHMLTTHPFTICSVSKQGHRNQLVFYIRPRDGLTGRLMKMSTKQPNMEVPVLMDGPYGGLPPHRSIALFDQSVVIGGGAGAGFTLAMVETYLQHVGAGEKVGLKMNVIVSTRDPEMRTWYTEALRGIADRYPHTAGFVGLNVNIYETGNVIKTGGSESPLYKLPDDTESKETEILTGKPRSTTPQMFNISFARGRPNLTADIDKAARQENTSSVGIVVCGPSSMVHDASAAAAAAQGQIISGRLRAREVWLHQECFS
ncbi:hypothetical protein FQN50_004523 [Emmonsiellopsis sp. PD_5]|nr:hypothetical protein FQN50_004523 [Emmonsiellopsis sp. PD_5]